MLKSILSFIIHTMEYISIGKAVNTHGLKGELKIESWSDFDEIRYQKGNTVYLYYQNQYQPFIVASYRPHKGYALVSFQGYQDINLIEQYKGCIVCMNAGERQQLEDGEHYIDQLIGMKVLDEEQQLIGIVKAVEETSGAQKNLRVERVNKEDALIPDVPEFVKKINDDRKEIIIHVEEGLL